MRAATFPSSSKEQRYYLLAEGQEVHWAEHTVRAVAAVPNLVDPKCCRLHADFFSLLLSYVIRTTLMPSVLQAKSLILDLFTSDALTKTRYSN